MGRRKVDTEYINVKHGTCTALQECGYLKARWYTDGVPMARERALGTNGAASLPESYSRSYTDAINARSVYGAQGSLRRVSSDRMFLEDLVRPWATCIQSMGVHTHLLPACEPSWPMQNVTTPDCAWSQHIQVLIGSVIWRDGHSEKYSPTSTAERSHLSKQSALRTNDQERPTFG
jgi:hypothetical protein